MARGIQSPMLRQDSWPLNRARKPRELASGPKHAIYIKQNDEKRDIRYGSKGYRDDERGDDHNCHLQFSCLHIYNATSGNIASPNRGTSSGALARFPSEIGDV